MLKHAEKTKNWVKHFNIWNLVTFWRIKSLNNPIEFKNLLNDSQNSQRRTSDWMKENYAHAYLFRNF